MLCPIAIAIALTATRPAGVPAWSLPAWSRGVVIRHAMLGRFATASLFADLKWAIAPVSDRAFAARLAAVMTVDVSDQLRAVEVPLLYICADSDRLVPASAGRYINAICSPARVVSIAAPHLLLQAAPSRAAQVLARLADERAR